MSVPADHEADEPPLTLAPPDPPRPADRPHDSSAFDERLKRIVVAAADDGRDDRWQFTLGQVLVANSLLAVVLALTHWMAPTLLAGALGLFAFGLFLFVAVYQPQQPGIYSLVWIMILIYVVAASVALLSG